MNALLQHRGHNLMGAGRSIAVQNFNEQAAILMLGAGYSLSTGLGLPTFGAITAFGLVIAGFMTFIKRWHARNCVQFGAEIQHLLSIARNDKRHGSEFVGETPHPYRRAADAVASRRHHD
jgi:hypothetical protein